ncbi:MAG: sensor histidine kinase, partial [Betaproteobacteria bacterium]
MIRARLGPASAKVPIRDEEGSISGNRALFSAPDARTLPLGSFSGAARLMVTRDDAAMAQAGAGRGRSGAAEGVLGEQVKLLYAHLPTSQVAAVLNASLLTFVQSYVMDWARILSWLVILVVVTLARMFLAFAFARDASAADHIVRWRNIFFAGAAVSGIVWGSSAWFLYSPDSEVHQVFLAFVLGGMVAGSVSVLTPVFGVFAVFAVSAIVPLAIRYLAAGDYVHYVMGGMCAIFTVAILTIGRQIHATIEESLRLRFENLAMIDDLVNARTHVESVNQNLLATQKALQKSNEELENRVADRTMALRAMDRRKDEFLAILSHELRNPLAPIRNSIYLLKHADPASPQAQQAREIIERQTDYVTRLVDDLLDVTRVARGKVELRRERVNLAEAVRRTGEDHVPTFREFGIDFRIEVPPDPVWMSADRTRIAQLIGNLLQNAANYTPAGGRATLALRVVGDFAQIEVTDSGAGISRELLPVLFEPFIQGTRSLARTEGGLGLGLALVKGISELHGGAVEAASEGIGKGASFVVRLPIRVEHGDAGNPGMAAPDISKNQRVLVVDDNRDAADTL